MFRDSEVDRKYVRIDWISIKLRETVNTWRNNKNHRQNVWEVVTKNSILKEFCLHWPNNNTKEYSLKEKGRKKLSRCYIFKNVIRSIILEWNCVKFHWMKWFTCLPSSKLKFIFLFFEESNTKFNHLWYRKHVTQCSQLIREKCE